MHYALGPLERLKEHIALWKGSMLMQYAPGNMCSAVCVLHPAVGNMRLARCTLLCPCWVPTCALLHALCNMPHATCFMQYALRNMPYATCPMQHALCNMRWTLWKGPESILHFGKAVCSGIMHWALWKGSKSILPFGKAVCSCNMHQATCARQHALCNMHCAICDRQHALGITRPPVNMQFFTFSSLTIFMSPCLFPNGCLFHFIISASIFLSSMLCGLTWPGRFVFSSFSNPISNPAISGSTPPFSLSFRFSSLYTTSHFEFLLLFWGVNSHQLFFAHTAFCFLLLFY